MDISAPAFRLQKSVRGFGGLQGYYFFMAQLFCNRTGITGQTSHSKNRSTYPEALEKRPNPPVAAGGFGRFKRYYFQDAVSGKCFFGDHRVL